MNVSAGQAVECQCWAAPENLVLSEDSQKDGAKTDQRTMMPWVSAVATWSWEGLMTTAVSGRLCFTSRETLRAIEWMKSLVETPHATKSVETSKAETAPVIRVVGSVNSMLLIVKVTRHLSFESEAAEVKHAILPLQNFIPNILRPVECVMTHRLSFHSFIEPSIAEVSKHPSGSITTAVTSEE